MRLAALALLLLSSQVVSAEEQTIRLGTVGPEGTAWARELRAMAREVEASSNHALHIKYYMGGIAGDELEMIERVRRGQLDGIFSGGMACETMAPSLRIVRIPGLLQTWAETSFVLGQLRTTLEQETRKSGFTFMGEAIIGPSIIFSRKPVRTLADLRHTRLWVWDLDRMLSTVLPDMGVPAMPLPINEASRALEDGRVDGVVTPAAVALAFQWSAATHYYTDLKMAFVVGCLLLANRAIDGLSLPLQQSLHVASARAKARFEEVGRTQEQQLINGLFERQGLLPVHVDETMRAAFFEEARAARERSASRLVPPALIARVLGMMADYRSAHP